MVQPAEFSRNVLAVLDALVELGKVVQEHEQRSQTTYPENFVTDMVKMAEPQDSNHEGK